MKQYQRSGNELVEVAEKQRSQFFKGATTYSDNQQANRDFRNYMASLQHIPIHPDYLEAFEFNKVYAEDDFEFLYQMLVNDKWHDVTYPVYSMSFQEGRRKLAIPKQKETEYYGERFGSPFEKLVYWATHEGWRYCQGKKGTCGNEEILKLSHFNSIVKSILKEEKQKETEDELWREMESYWQDILSNKSFRERVELRIELKSKFNITKK